jgi:hypothetical protein
MAEHEQETGYIGLDLASTSKETLELFVEEAADPAIFREILDANRHRSEVVELLLTHANTPEEVRTDAAQVLSVPVPKAEDMALMKRREAEQRAREIQEQVREERLVKRIQKLTVSEKIKFAMRGNNEVRGVLARDSNKLVVLAVLDNPKMTESEVESLARNRSIMEEALRTIAKNREWMRNYNVQHSLVTNPKTPVAISLKLVSTLKKKDMQLLEKNKNVSDAIRNTARKFVKSQKV